MKNYEKYFEKNGFLFGVSSKYNFGKWSHHLYFFIDLGRAEEWLHTETYDFRERELVSKSTAIKVFGKKHVSSVSGMIF